VNDAKIAIPGTIVYAVYVETDDFYDNGDMYCIHATAQGAVACRNASRGIVLPAKGRIIDSWVNIVVVEE